jgi:replicative DNA helicase
MYDIQIKEDIREISLSEDYLFVDEKGNELDKSFLKAGTNIQVRDSFVEIKEVNIKDNRINLKLDYSSHLYYTNGMVSHNTLLLTSVMADALRSGKETLYISTEMSEEEIMERVFANLLEIKMDDLKDNVDKIQKAMENWKEKYPNFHIKMFPSGMCTHMTIRNVLNNLMSKENFYTKILIVDQLTTMGSTLKGSNLYENGKDIVSGIKGITQEYDLIGFSASQANREGSTSKSGLEMKDSAESWAIPQIVDVLIGATKKGDNKSIDSYNYSLRIDFIKNRTAGILGTSYTEVDSNYMKFS